MDDIEKTIRTRVTRIILQELIRTDERLNIAAGSGLVDDELKLIVGFGGHFKYNNKKRRTWAGCILDRLQVYRRIEQCFNSVPTPPPNREANQLHSIMTAIVRGDERFVQPIIKMIQYYFKNDGSYKNGYSGCIFNYLTFTILSGLLPTQWITSPLASVVLQTMAHSYPNQMIITVTNSSFYGLFTVLQSEKTDLLDEALWPTSPTTVVLSGCQQYHWLGAIVWEGPSTQT